MINMIKGPKGILAPEIWNGLSYFDRKQVQKALDEENPGKSLMVVRGFNIQERSSSWRDLFLNMPGTPLRK